LGAFDKLKVFSKMAVFFAIVFFVVTGLQPGANGTMGKALRYYGRNVAPG
jgi:hypothetical protein